MSVGVLDNLRRGYIVGPGFDWMFFLAPPTLALVVGMMISGTSFAESEFEIWGHETAWSSFLIGILIHAHVVIVFFRSHGNIGIFKQHPLRFVAVPILLYLAMVFSEWALVSIAVLATFWDVYHSGMQTFGFGRIYDARSGNLPNEARTLDLILNQLLYAGPIVGGATMMAHFENFETFEDVGATFFTAIPAVMDTYHSDLAWGLMLVGGAFLVYYVYAYWRLARRGYRISPHKIFLYVTTGACSIYTWGFNSWGEAFFIMNLFHAVQYFALVWNSEEKHMMKMFRLEGLRIGRFLCVAILILPAAMYGLFVELLDTDFEALWALTLVVSIMHFWYDGFVWSVRRNQV